jgi:hypothetical protein
MTKQYRAVFGQSRLGPWWWIIPTDLAIGCLYLLRFMFTEVIPLWMSLLIALFTIFTLAAQ